MDRDDLTLRKIRHINNHLTPLALLIVVPGLLVSEIPPEFFYFSLILMAYAVLINYLSVYVLKAKPAVLTYLRMGSNYTVNIFLLWMLYRQWPLVWVLLLLLSMGPAIYQSRHESFMAAAAIAALLFVVHWQFAYPHSVYNWTVAGAKVSIIVLVNLFINGLLKFTTEEARAGA